MRLDQSSVWRRLRHLPCLRLLLTYCSQRLTPAGRAVFLIWLVVTIPGFASFDVPLYHIWSCATAILAVSWLLAILAVPKVRLTRRHLQPVMAGTRFTINVDIENLSRRAAYGLTAMEIDLPNGIQRPNDTDPPVIKRLGPGETASLPIQLFGAQRGIYHLVGLYAASAFPLGVCRGIRFVRQPASLVIHPAYTLPSEFAIPTRYPPIGGDVAQGFQAAGSTEFVHTREYQAGDHLRHLHWAAWARTGSPAIKVYRDEELRHIGLILDIGTAATNKETTFETAISAMAGIGAALTQQGWTLHSLIAGGDVYQLVTSTDPIPFQPLLDVLAGLQPTAQTNWRQVTATLTLKAQPLHAVVAVLLDWSSESIAFIDRLQQHDIAIRILVVRDGPTSSPAPVLPPLSHYQQVRPDELWSQLLDSEETPR